MESNVVVDLRECEFVWPSAVLWCAVYPLLASLHSSKCSLLVPTNTGVCMYLKSLGLFRILQQNGIEADDREILEGDSGQIVLPLTQFDSETQVDDVTNDISETLQDSGLGAANLHSVVSETFAELAMNAVQHAESPIGAYGFVQFHQFA